MPLAAGVRLGPYEVSALIGQGGMGEVYRARDSKLQRDVALKVLPDAFAQDGERLARFEREARTLASLNHPNIAVIHGLEESDGVKALVMELVEGPTLADRIAQGAVPIDEAVPIAKQIAEALEAAHEQGIIHRDLKPANVKVRADGTVKVLDFGLAKAMEPIGAMAASVSQAPTITTPAMMTGAGVILGTAAYMSPEQARGKPVDKRTDIWAFGCVLYEMLTGRRLFEANEVSDVLALVLMQQPDWNALPARTPPALRRLLRRCLEKDKRRRLDSAADARLEIDDALRAPDDAGPSQQVPPRTLWHARLVWMTAAALAGATTAATFVGAWVYTARTPPSRPTVRLLFSLPDEWAVRPLNTDGYGYIAVSHDGRRVAVVGSKGAERRIWVRSLDMLDAQPLQGTEGALSPFWSPDDGALGFFADGKLKKIDVAGGPPIVLCDAPDNRGGSWSSTGVILFSVGQAGLQQVPASGGVATAATTLTTGETGHVRPQFLPDGRHFLFSLFSSSQDRAIYVGTLGTTDRVRLLDSDSGQYYYSAGHLLFLRDATLMAQPFDGRRAALTGDAFPVADRVHVVGAANLFSASEAPVLAYQTEPGVGGRTELEWFDRAGKATGVLGEAGDYGDVELSPDGTRAAVGVLDPMSDTYDVWLYDLARGVRTRFTFDAKHDMSPVWSPDGTRLVWASNRKGVYGLYQKQASGTGTDELLLDANGSSRPDGWSADGQYMLYSLLWVGKPNELWALPMTGDRQPFPYLQTPFDTDTSRFSPDGRWVAYTSLESGRAEVYVAPFPRADGKWQVSTAGGALPRWRRDGKELFYLAPDNTLMAADISTPGTAVQVGTVRPLFQTHIIPNPNRRFAYDVSTDGQRFLINSVPDTASAPVTVVIDWTAGLTR